MTKPFIGRIIIGLVILPFVLALFGHTFLLKWIGNLILGLINAYLAVMLITIFGGLLMFLCIELFAKKKK